MCLLLSTIFCNFRKLNLGIMHTKFYFLLGLLVGFTSITSTLVSQTACFDTNQGENVPAGFSLTVETLATFDGSESSPAVAALAGQTTYRICVTTPSEMDFVSSVSYDGGSGDVSLTTSTEFFKHEFGGLTVNNINAGLFSFFPALEFDSYVSIGLDAEAGFGEESIILSGEDQWGESFLMGQDLVIDSSASAGSGWSVPSGASNGYAGSDMKVMIAQVTTDGDIDGSFNVEIYPGGESSEAFSYQFGFSSELCGCTDDSAENFQASATSNDGSCIYLGCMDAIACNFDEIATDDDGSCDYCCVSGTSTNSDFSLDVELHADGGVAGMQTYRLYVNAAHADDVVYAVSGEINNPLFIGTTTSFFQFDPALGGGVTPNSWNDEYANIPLAAAGAYDSYVTIGISEMPDASLNEVNVQTVEDVIVDPSLGWEIPFEAGGNIDASTPSGGAWFVVGNVPNGIVGDDNRVLLGQFTTDGFLYGHMLVSIAKGGQLLESVDVYMTFSAPSCGCMDPLADNYNGAAEYQDGDCFYLGCTDEEACNYVMIADTDDGSCEYPEYAYDCNGSCINDTDGDYTCDENEVPGCLNPNACNYVEISLVTDLETCVFPLAGFDCDGNCVQDIDEDGVCDVDEVGGCNDETACNYDASATDDNGTCYYLESVVLGDAPTVEVFIYDCNDECFNDVDENGICDELEVLGCMDTAACNYDAANSQDDGSCDYCCATSESVDGYFVSVEETGMSPEGMTYRMYVNMTSPSDVLSVVSGNEENEVRIESTQPFFKSMLNPGVTPNALLPVTYGIFPELAYDSWITIGIDQAPSSDNGEGEVSVSTASDTNWEDEFLAGNNIVINSFFGAAWFVTYAESTGLYSNGLAGDDMRVLVGQFTTHGVISGELYVQIFPEGVQANNIAVSLPFGYGSEDDEAPVFTSVPEDMAQSCSEAWPSEMAVATDSGCFSDVVVTVEESVVDTDCGYDLIRTFTATDAFGNEATAVQNVSVSDNEAPVAVAQADFVANCADDLSPGAGIAEFPMGSYDNCDSSEELSYSFSDSFGSSGLDLTGVVMDLHVEMGMNVQGPFGASLILESTGVTVGEGYELTYDDLTSNLSSHRGAITVDIDGDNINLNVQGTLGFPYQYDYAVVSLSNIDGEAIGGVNVLSNGIAGDADFLTSFTSNSITLSFNGTAIYSENESASLSVDNQSTCLANQSIIRTWTVADGCGNSDTAVQTIALIDNEGPVFTSTPVNMELSCNDEIPMSEVTADDCTEVEITMTETSEAGSCEGDMTYYRTFTATDDCGNESSHTQVIMVVDNDAPEFTSFPSDITYTSGDDMEQTEPTASDECNAVSISFSDSVDNSDINVTVITRTWTASDACGNSVSQNQIVTVNEVLGCMDAAACNYLSSASYDDGSCDYCSCGTGGAAGFGLDYELVMAHDGSIDPELEGLNTYRVYVTTPGTEDFVSSVSGDEMHPAFLNTSTSFYQHFAGSINPNALNPAFFLFVPAMEYDSWLTIGIDQSPSEYGAESNYADVSFTPEVDSNWQSDFEAGNNLTINTFVGGAWFSINSSANGYAGEDERVLVAQLTTDGALSGQLYVQVFPNGDSSQEAYLTLSFGGSDCGCLDEVACNYAPNAIYDNGFCDYAEAGYACDGVCIVDTDGDGVCDEFEVTGCTIETNCAYDANATEYDAEACDSAETCIGCSDEAACNYNSNADSDSDNAELCEYPEEGFSCNGECIDWNGDLICDILQGCNDLEACNYEESEYPSLDFCDFCGCDNVYSSNPDFGIEIEAVESGVEGATTYKVYLTTPNSTDVLNAILGNELNPIILGSSSQFFQDPAGSLLPTPASMFGFFPQLAYDSYVTIGDNTPNDFIQFASTESGDLPEWTYDFEAGGNIEINDAIGSGWYLDTQAGSFGYGVAGDDNRVLMAQLTTPGVLYGELFLQVFPDGLSAGNTMYLTMSFGSEACGCTDEAACNYEGDNLTDDGSCYFAPEGVDCGDVCLYDTSEPTILFIEDYFTSCETVDTDIREPLSTDNCDSDLNNTYTDSFIAGECEGSYTIIRTWTVTDNAGYMDSGEQTITVVDQTAPTFTAPAEASISCLDDVNDLSLTGDVNDADDSCGSSTIVSYSDAFGDSNCFEGDVIIRTWTVADDCGNASSQDQVINLIDDNAPFFTDIPEDLELQCGDELPSVFATAEDACSSVEVTISDEYGDANCTGMEVLYRTFIAEDACGNFGYAVQTITRVDSEAPVASVEDFDIGCGQYDAAAEYGSYEFSDNCMSNVTVSWMELSSGDSDEIGCFDVQREYTFTDGCGNASTAIQTVSVFDEEAPVMDELAGTFAEPWVNENGVEIVAEVVLMCGEALPAAPGATDACSSVEVTFEDDFNGYGCTGEMHFLRTYTATDACGNAVSATMSVSYDDDIAPTFTTPADVTLECDTDLSDLALAGDVMDAVDVCSADITVEYSDSFSTTDGSCLANNRVERTWTLTDGCGNSASGVQTITLEDTTAPEVTFEAFVILSAENSQDLSDFEGVEVYEACGSYTYTTSDVYVGSSILGYELNRTMVFTDDCGNSTTIDQTITAIFSSGCTYPDAVNFNLDALVDDGSCVYEGCLDGGAANYNPIASVDDGSCVIVGCMDPAGYDYDENANYPGGCDYPDSCPGDINLDGEVNVADLLEFFQYYGVSCGE